MNKCFWLSVMGLALAPLALRGDDNPYPYAAGPYQATWESLRSQYHCPDWFRDAKFGIWAHWTAQCVPEQGDWYARNMYVQPSDPKKVSNYTFHVAHYGHPSKFGFKDIDHLWKAEKWEPEQLLALYKRAGAKYFVALANHHDNFDCYDSKYQPWNSVSLGPKKDLVGEWAAAARKNGLHFGVTVHAARTWTWFEVAQGADASGPLAGVPYDGKLTRADGKGQWWEGLDPQDLYAQNHAPGAKPDAAYCRKFYNRTLDLIDKYHPDLLYFDDSVLPLRGEDERIGLGIAAHLYNSSLQWHAGRNEAVMNTKGLNEEQRQALVWDIERGISDRLEPFAWQTDTCIGAWHYLRSLYDRQGYKTPTMVIQQLVDIVSKNGNLLLNVPVRGDGTIDEEEVKCLEGIAAWMQVNHEAIFATRPWKVYGEGYRHAKAGSGNFNEGKRKGYTSEDFRFTTQGNTLYAIALAWPQDGKLVIKTLGRKQAGLVGKVAQVELLGAGPMPFETTDTGLVVSVPEQKPCDHAFVLRITGLDLAASQPAECITVIPFFVRADDKGVFRCNVDEADLHGKRIKLQGHGSKANLGHWDDPADYATWPLDVARPGKFHVLARMASQRQANQFAVEIAGQMLVGTAPKTATWEDFAEVKLGTVEIRDAGKTTLTVRPAGDAKQRRAVNLASIQLRPAK